MLQIVNDNFDLRPGVIIRFLYLIFKSKKKLFFRELDLKRPIYSRTAANGHFGHSIFPWEKPRQLKIRPELAKKLADFKKEGGNGHLPNGVFKH